MNVLEFRPAAAGVDLKAGCPVASYPPIASYWLRLGVIDDRVIEDSGTGWTDVLHLSS